jgi:single-stranded-DNA-specific exonuclease
MRKPWRFLPHDQSRIERLMGELRLPAIAAQLLVNRGIYDAPAAEQFLETRLAALRDPMLLPGVPAAVSAILDSIAQRRKFIVHGDYDADGMTSAAILVRTLQLLGADAGYHVPNRLEEGYGLNIDSLERLAELGAQTIITVDCGIGSVREAERAAELGLQLIITDHHQFGHALPTAAAIVHPRLPGTAYPFGELCGAGVAFKLSWALCQQVCGSAKVTERMRSALMQALGLAAIGTVADMVPLLDENRILVCNGLKALKAYAPPGLTALLKIAGLTDRKELSTDDIGFGVAPRLNAAGRLGQAQLGIELLVTDNATRGEALAEYLHQLNSSRESLERSVYLAAHKQAKEEFDPDQDAALVLGGVGWHPGVIGVVAGRLADKYSRPVVVLSLDATGSRPAVGSARSAGMVDLHSVLGDCQSWLVAHGGHAAAAGLKLEPDRLAGFREEFCQRVAQSIESGQRSAEFVIDAEAPLGQLNFATLEAIDRLAPFGQGNPRPLLCAAGVRLVEPARRIGGGERHLAAKLKQGSVELRAVAFGQGDWVDELNQLSGPFDVAFRPVVNEFRGRRAVELQLVDWRPAV